MTRREINRKIEELQADVQVLKMMEPSEPHFQKPTLITRFKTWWAAEDWLLRISQIWMALLGGVAVIALLVTCVMKPVVGLVLLGVLAIAFTFAAFMLIGDRYL